MRCTQLADSQILCISHAHAHLALGAYVCSFLHHLIPLKRRSHHFTLLIRLLVQSSIVILHSFRAKGAHFSCLLNQMKLHLGRRVTLQIFKSSRAKWKKNRTKVGCVRVLWDWVKRFFIFSLHVMTYKELPNCVTLDWCPTEHASVYRIQRRWTNGRFSIWVFINGNFNSLTPLNEFHYLKPFELDWN